MTSGPYRNVLVVRQHDQLGDMLCAVPLFRILRSLPGTEHLTLVASPVNFEIMKHHPSVDSLLLYDKKEFWRSPARAASFLRSLRSRPYDLVVVPATVSLSSTSNLLAFLSGGTQRLGPASLEGRKNSTSWCFTRDVPLSWSSDSHRHQSLRNLDILAPLGISTADLAPSIGLTGQERAAAGDVVAPMRSKFRHIVSFHPGAGKVPNRWPADRFAMIANVLAETREVGIMITEGPMDSGPVEDMKAHLRQAPVVIKNRTIREVAAILDQVDLVVSNDTGILHIAGGTSPKVLGLFGPTDPLQWAPIGPKNRFKVSETGDISTISVRDVEEEVLKLLGSPAKV